MKEDIMEVDRAKEQYTCVNISTLEKLGKQIELLQEQLDEANKALKEVCMHAETEHFECRCGWVEPCKDCNAHYAARDYLKKWGVK